MNIEDLINNSELEIHNDNLNEPNPEFTIEESVNWYYQNHQSDFWKKQQIEDVKLDYSKLLELIKKDYTQEGFEASFTECMNINKNEGKTFKESLVNTMQSFEQALTLNIVCEKMGKYISAAIMAGILAGDKHGLLLIVHLLTLIIQDKITPDNVNDINDILDME